MRTFIALSLLGLSPLAIAPAHAEDTVEMPARGVIFHLSHGKDQPHHVIHPLVRAKHMSAAGLGVLVYVDADAASLVFKDATAVTFHDHDSTQLLKEILANGGKVALCGECAQANEKAPADLLDGVTIAKPDMFFEVGEKTVTFDY